MSSPAVIRDARVESWEDHVEAWHHLGRQVDGAAWARAAIAASLKGRYGDDAVGRFAEEVGFSRAAVYQFAKTFEAFPEKSTRVDNLTFTHHRHAAVLATNSEQARVAVDLAGREGWSANALRAYLRPPEPVQIPHAAEQDSGAVCTVPGSCGPITDADKALHVWAFTENFYAVKDYDVGRLVQQSTKKSVRELSEKVEQMQRWLTALQRAIKERAK